MTAVLTKRPLDRNGTDNLSAYIDLTSDEPEPTVKRLKHESHVRIKSTGHQFGSTPRVTSGKSHITQSSTHKIPTPTTSESITLDDSDDGISIWFEQSAPASKPEPLRQATTNIPSPSYAVSQSLSLKSIPIRQNSQSVQGDVSPLQSGLQPVFPLLRDPTAIKFDPDSLVSIATTKLTTKPFQPLPQLRKQNGRFSTERPKSVNTSSSKPPRLHQSQWDRVSTDKSPLLGELKASLRETVTKPTPSVAASNTVSITGATTRRNGEGRSNSHSNSPSKSARGVRRSSRSKTPQSVVLSSISADITAKSAVVLGSRSQGTVLSSASVALKPVPHTFTSPKQVFSINLPPTPQAKERTRQKWIRSLQKDKDVQLIKEHGDEIHDADMLGNTGFAAIYKVDNEAIYKRVAQKKRRTVDTTELTLDFADLAVSKPVAQRPRSKLILPQQQAQAVLLDRFSSISPPLTFAENPEHRRLDGKFQFVSGYVAREGVTSRKKKHAVPISTCACVDGCIRNCLCSRRPFQANSNGPDTHDTYYYNSEGKMVLTEAYLDLWRNHAEEIVECGDHCGCGPECNNKIVQRGRTIPLEVFLTARCGFGVRSPQPISKGQFIDLYLGELLTNIEVERRDSASEEAAPSYIFALDQHISDTNALWYVDGANFGSPMRFVNHSCEPNARVIVVASPNGEKQLHFIAFFADQDIPAGTEITIDYDPTGEHLTDEDLAKLSEGVTRCKCGMKSCRGIVWREKDEEKRKRKRKRIFARSS